MTNTTRTHVLCLVLALAVAAPGAALAEPFKVVANPSVKEAALTRDQLSRIFLKKATRWADGKEIRPVEPRTDAAIRATFSGEVHRMEPDAVRSYWGQMIFSGRDVPPVEKGTDEQIVAYVREHPGSVGYVSAGADAAGVKVLEVRR